MEALIYQTIAQVMQKINAISKGRKNQQQGFNFRGIDDVMNELHPVMAECGLFVVPTVEHEERSTGQTRSGGSMFYTRLTVRFTFYAQDGSNLSAVVIGEAMDSGDKASNKALSIALKYALLQVFCIPTEDEKDPDASSPQLEMSQAAQNERKQEMAKAPATKPAAQKPAAQKPAPQPKKRQLAGGDSTPEEANEIKTLLETKDAAGNPLFNHDDKWRYSKLREELTAAEEIEAIKGEILKKQKAQAEMQAQEEELDAIF